ncbi:hypothetical protein SBA4_2370006 [Candidatus Sulfopaludibacter sp. SbA4]|nr:hypothetical protein SBA4_2370006 [Candidatus Sulfopaludibacter sp. SbA4]
MAADYWRVASCDTREEKKKDTYFLGTIFKESKRLNFVLTARYLLSGSFPGCCRTARRTALSLLIQIYTHAIAFTCVSEAKFLKISRKYSAKI